MSGTIVRRFSRCVSDRIRSILSSSDPIWVMRYSAIVWGSVSRGNGRSDDDDDEEEVTEEELKRRIQKFYDGDGEALPLIFEGILKRKLAGKNDKGLIVQLPISRRHYFTESSEEKAYCIYSAYREREGIKAKNLIESEKLEELGKEKYS